MTAVGTTYEAFHASHGSSPIEGAVSFDAFASGVHEIYTHLTQIAQELDIEHPNLIALQRAVAEQNSAIFAIEEIARHVRNPSDAPGVQRMLETLHGSIAIINTRLAEEPLKTTLREQKKWVEAGFPEEIVVTDPEAVHFAVSSDLLYTILMYKNASDALDGEEITIRFQDGKALFKVEGSYIPYDKCKETIRYSPEEKKFLGWNFVHPYGFILKDASSFDAIYPIARLKPEVCKRILDTASHFWSEDQDEVDPGEEKNFVLQVMTTGRRCFPSTWWGNNADDMTPEHTSSRLITPDGYVFSFGTKMRPADADKVTSLSNFLATAMSTTSAPDYEEPRSSNEKRVTSIPLTQERFDAILRFVNETNKGFPFNFPTQNCARFVTAQMALAGVNVDIKMSVAQFFYGMLPNLEQVPLIGTPLSKLIAAVAFVAVPIIDSLCAVLRNWTPRFVQTAWVVVTGAILEVFRRIGAVFINSIFFFAMGGGKSFISPDQCKEQDQQVGEGVSLPMAPRLMQWWDIFNPDAITIYHAFKLRQWQYKQDSTTLYEKPQFGLSCIDPIQGKPATIRVVC